MIECLCSAWQPFFPLSVLSLQPPKSFHVSRSRSCGVCHRRYGHSVATLLLLWL